MVKCMECRFNVTPPSGPGRFYCRLECRMIREPDTLIDRDCELFEELFVSSEEEKQDDT